MLRAMTPPIPTKNLPIVIDLIPIDTSTDDFGKSILNLDMGKFDGYFRKIVQADKMNMSAMMHLHRIKIYDDSVGADHEHNDIIITTRYDSEITFYSKLMSYTLYGYIHQDTFMVIGFIPDISGDSILARLITSTKVDLINSPLYNHQYHKRCNIVYTGDGLFIVYSNLNSPLVGWEVSDILIWDRHHYGSSILDWIRSSTNVSLCNLTDMEL